MRMPARLSIRRMVRDGRQDRLGLRMVQCDAIPIPISARRTIISRTGAHRGDRAVQATSASAHARVRLVDLHRGKLTACTRASRSIMMLALAIVGMHPLSTTHVPSSHVHPIHRTRPTTDITLNAAHSRKIIPTAAPKLMQPRTHCRARSARKARAVVVPIIVVVHGARSSGRKQRRRPHRRVRSRMNILRHRRSRQSASCSLRLTK